MTLYIPFRLLQNPIKKIHLRIKYSNSVHTHRGFALIATLTLMILLAILAIGMLSLSAVSLRSSAQTDGITEARANARMALMLALGELQMQMGPDQRVSANGAILDNPDSSSDTVLHPHWTGVWDSWIAGNPNNASVNPDYPNKSSSDFHSHHQTIGPQSDNSMRPDYANKNKHFRKWLVSLSVDEATNKSAADLITSIKDISLNGVPFPEKDATAVQLVGKGSLGSSALPEDYVNVQLIEMKDQGSTMPKGRYGWWVGDESQKARIMADSYSSNPATSIAGKIFRSQAPGSTGTKLVEGLEGITTDRQLSKLASLSSLNLITGVTGKPGERNFHNITPYSYSVLADVREGGLKRDLNAILERNIDPNEVYELQSVSGVEAEFKRATSMKPPTSNGPGGNDFMLYRFDNMVNGISPTGEASVPIQDLAAYYQLYDHDRAGWKGGIQFTSQKSSPPNSQLGSGIMVSNPDYGVTDKDYTKYLRQHSALYRSVYPVKIEFVLSYITEPRPQAEIDLERNGNPSATPPVPPNPNPDTHRLKVGITPAMTWWNPNNVPVIMNFGNPDLASIMIRENAVPLQLLFYKGKSANDPNREFYPFKIDKGVRVPDPVQMTRLTNTQQGELYTLFVSGASPVIFQPGESKVLALKFSSQTNADQGQTSLDFYLRGTGNRFNEPFVPSLELIPGWNPERFIRPTGRNGVALTGYLNFKESDYISAAINTGTNRNFSVDFTQKSRHGRVAPGVMWHYRSYGLRMRMFPGGFPNFTVYAPFLTAFNSAGMNPTGGSVANTAMGSGVSIPARSGQILINSVQDPANFVDDIPQSFFYYGMKAATETHESIQSFPASGAGAGRRFPSRPFTHSTAMIPQFIDSINGASLYNTGWNWYYMPLNNILDAPISISRDNHGYYGGGYTAENGTTHVVQQELPVTPPISIAALSHAQLSGYSISSEAAAAGYGGLNNLNGTEAFRRTTAIGFGGLEPRTLQAIGNSYAHPNIPKDKAITTLNRIYFQNTGTEANHRVAEPFADHSYLANKALWDEYFFSSITPVPSNNPIFDSSPKTVGDVANDFFFGEEPLPNRRMVPYTNNLDQQTLTSLVSQHATFQGGFADKIAASMMVEGALQHQLHLRKSMEDIFLQSQGKTCGLS